MNDFKFWAAAGRLSGLGLTLAAVIVIGLFIGINLDKKFGTAPIFTLILLVAGIVGGFIYIFNEVRSIKWK